VPTKAEQGANNGGNHAKAALKLHLRANQHHGVAGHKTPEGGSGEILTRTMGGFFRVCLELDGAGCGGGSSGGSGSRRRIGEKGTDGCSRLSAECQNDEGGIPSRAPWGTIHLSFEFPAMAATTVRVRRRRRSMSAASYEKSHLRRTRMSGDVGARCQTQAILAPDRGASRGDASAMDERFPPLAGHAATGRFPVTTRRRPGRRLALFLRSSRSSVPPEQFEAQRLNFGRSSMRARKDGLGQGPRCRGGPVDANGQPKLFAGFPSNWRGRRIVKFVVSPTQRFRRAAAG